MDNIDTFIEVPARDGFNELICMAPESQNSFVQIAMCSVILWTWELAGQVVSHMIVICKPNVYYCLCMYVIIFFK